MLQRIYFAPSTGKTVEKRYPVSIPRNSRLPLARPIPRIGPRSDLGCDGRIVYPCLVHSIPQYAQHSRCNIRSYRRLHGKKYTRRRIYRDTSTFLQIHRDITGTFRVRDARTTGVFERVRVNTMTLFRHSRYHKITCKVYSR